MPGMTVLPSSATRSAPAGTCARLGGATLTILPFCTTIVAFSIGGRAVPSITRAPVKGFAAGALAGRTPGGGAANAPGGGGTRRRFFGDKKNRIAPPRAGGGPPLPER